MTPVNDLAVVGSPLAYGAGFTALLVLAFSALWARSLITIAHEGGHVLAAVLTFRGPTRFVVKHNADGSTELDTSFGVGDYLVTFAGYAFPPVLGLGGALLVANGNPWAVLWSSLFLLFGAYMYSGDLLTNALVLIPVFGIGWVAVAGGPQLQAGVAVGLAWWLLIGGLLDAIGLSRRDLSDAYWLARRTLVPRIVWHGIWVVIAIACLWRGGRALLGF